MYSKIIYLIGPMGSGKSTIGKMLAQRTGLSFLDIDREIERRSGVSIGWIFDKEGEEGFRQRETALLRELSTQQAMVVATGGGSVVRQANQYIIRESGFVVFLETSLKVQIERTSKDKRRPLLQNGVDRATILSNIYADRLKLYHQLADLTINTDAGSPYIVIKAILNKIYSH